MKKSELGKLLVDYTESLEEGSSVSEFDETDETAPLFETVRTLSSVMQPKQPSEEFSARIFQAVQAKAAQEEFQEKVAKEQKNSAEKIQKIIAMAVTDGSFRKGFFHDVVAACRGVGFDRPIRSGKCRCRVSGYIIAIIAAGIAERIQIRRCTGHIYCGVEGDG